MNKTGPKILPCGTPQDTKDKTLFTYTDWLLLFSWSFCV